MKLSFDKTLLVLQNSSIFTDKIHGKLFRIFDLLEDKLCFKPYIDDVVGWKNIIDIIKDI